MEDAAFVAAFVKNIEEWECSSRINNEDANCYESDLEPLTVIDHSGLSILPQCTIYGRTYFILQRFYRSSMK